MTYIHGGTSAKLSRWSMMMQGFDYGIAYTPGETIPVPDTQSRAPAGRTLKLAALRLSDFNTDHSTGVSADLGAVAVASAASEPSEELVDLELEKYRTWFLQVHNDTEGHRGVQETLRRLQQAGHTWKRMSRDVSA